jgi:hypothetical protein
MDYSILDVEGVMEKINGKDILFLTTVVSPVVLIILGVSGLIWLWDHTFVAYTKWLLEG